MLHYEVHELLVTKQINRLGRFTTPTADYDFNNITRTVGAGLPRPQPIDRPQ